METNKSGEVVLCAASEYEQKYYFNQSFSHIPEDVKDQLHIICVLFTEDIGGIIMFVFDEEGNLQIRTEAKESDFNYDEIGAALTLKEIRKNRRELMEQLELFYKVVLLGIPLEEA